MNNSQLLPLPNLPPPEPPHHKRARLAIWSRCMEVVMILVWSPATIQIIDHFIAPPTYQYRHHHTDDIHDNHDNDVDLRHTQRRHSCQLPPSVCLQLAGCSEEGLVIIIWWMLWEVSLWAYDGEHYHNIISWLDALRRAGLTMVNIIWTLSTSW